MPHITIQSPIDQPTGKSRLFNGLQDCLGSEEYNKFRLVVAFAKVGPLLRLEKSIDDWLSRGGTIEAIFGVDEKGTSVEALEFSLAKFSKVYIAHVQAGAFNPTFHPKIYHFEGPEKSRLYIGSNNLTVGGIETNSETNICLDFSHGDDEDLLNQARTIWHGTLSFSKPLDEQLLTQLKDLGMVVNEKAMRLTRVAARRTTETSSETATSLKIDFPTIKIVRPSPLPKSTFHKHTPSDEPTHAPKERATEELVTTATEGLVIQITPQHNGEVYLSKSAVNQNQSFFSFPFQGLTTPKKAGNQPYQQRVPDPVVDINLYSANGDLALSKVDFRLNTVYYERKSEIRITVPPDVRQGTPPYSILVMSIPDNSDKDYILDIYAPGSDQYESYLQSCNQTMPSGGNAQPRAFGWL